MVARHTRSSPGPSHGDDGVVDALTAKLREERAGRLAAVRDLEDKLAAAHGEILRLRRVLQQHGIQTRPSTLPASRQRHYLHKHGKFQDQHQTSRR